MIGPWPGFEPGQTGWLGPGPAGRLFLRPPTLTADNFAALWPTDSKFLALKDLNPFKTVSKVQKTSSILRVGFALSKWPHLHRAYVVGGCIFNLGTVWPNVSNWRWLYVSTLSCLNLPHYSYTGIPWISRFWYSRFWIFAVYDQPQTPFMDVPKLRYSIVFYLKNDNNATWYWL